MHQRRPHGPAALVAPAVTAAVSFVAYLGTLLPGIAFGDWGEMQTVPHVLGVAHPTGYPTYIVLSWLAQLVPIGSIAFRANLLSAVFVSAALAVTVAILLRLGVRPVIAIGAALALGAVRTVWSAATVAEVNPLHLLFVALLIHRALAWEERRSVHDLALGGLFLGLALGNHLLILFIGPFLVAFVAWVGRRELAARPSMLLTATAGGLLGAAVYLYIPVAAGRLPPLAYNHPVTFDAFVFLVSGAQFRGQFGFFSPHGLAELVDSLPALWSLLVNRATPIVPILGLIGIVLLVRRRRAFGMTCVAILLANVHVWANYLRLEHYLLVTWLVLGLGSSIALESVARMVARRAPRVPRVPRLERFERFDAGALVGGAAVVFAVSLGGLNWAASDRSGDRSGEAYVDAVFEALPPNAAILSEWDASTPLWHGQHVLGRRPDVLIVDDTNIVYDGWGSRERRISALICERPVFILRLRDDDLQPTRAGFRVEPFIEVRVALGGPSAAVVRPVYRGEPRDPAACP